MTALAHRPLGTSGVEVSVLSLGSWQTYERIPRESGAAVLARARECGVDFLEVARYNDQTGTAPLKTGYSEVVFGEIFRASGWPRDEVLIANKLWWEFWPDQSAAQELDASLDRTGLDHFDFVYSDPPPAQLVYGLVRRSVVDDPEMLAALHSCPASVVASWALAGGVLTGKYAAPEASGRYAGALDTPRVQPAVRAVEQLRSLA